MRGSGRVESGVRGAGCKEEEGRGEGETGRGKGGSLSTENCKKLKKSLHSCNTVVTVAGDMEPGAWIYKCWIPALKDIIWICQRDLPSMKSIHC